MILVPYQSTIKIRDSAKIVLRGENWRINHIELKLASNQSYVIGLFPMKKIAIQVSDLTFDYTDKRALFGVSFSITEGSVTALVGPNGSGKTTLLRLLAALETPYSGKVLIDGINTQESPQECHAKMGYLSDSFGLYDDLRVRQCLEHAASMRSLRGQSRHSRIDHIVEMVGLKKFLYQRAGSLSRGQRQRVGIAQALIHNPKIILLDEPAAGLDPEARHELSSLVLSLRQKGLTLVISSHILAELSDYSESMLTLNDGKILGHVAVGDGAGTTGGTKLLLKVVGDPSAALELLKKEPDVREATVVSNGIVITCSFKQQEDQAIILKHLIMNDIPVLSFVEQRADMQEIYLEQVAERGVISRGALR
jgi:ABC-2 type transport system ATP-binding protein